jgi:hypothetical protein
VVGQVLAHSGSVSLLFSFIYFAISDLVSCFWSEIFYLSWWGLIVFQKKEKSFDNLMEEKEEAAADAVGTKEPIIPKGITKVNYIQPVWLVYSCLRN